MTGDAVETQIARSRTTAQTVRTFGSFGGAVVNTFAPTGETGVAGACGGDAATATMGAFHQRQCELMAFSAEASGTGGKGGHNAEPVFTGAPTVGAGLDLLAHSR